MYHGNFAAGLLVKAVYEPSILAWPIMMGSSILDIIDLEHLALMMVVFGKHFRLGQLTTSPVSAKKPVSSTPHLPSCTGSWAASWLNPQP
jgi:hypothetical protein